MESSEVFNLISMGAEKKGASVGVFKYVAKLIYFVLIAGIVFGLLTGGSNTLIIITIVSIILLKLYEFARLPDDENQGIHITIIKSAIKGMFYGLVISAVILYMIGIAGSHPQNVFILVFFGVPYGAVLGAVFGAVVGAIASRKRSSKSIP